MSFESSVPPAPGPFDLSLDSPVAPDAPRHPSVNAGAIVRSDFARVRRDGFDPDQVVDHLRRVANHVADLEAKVAKLEEDLRARAETDRSDERAREDVYQSVAARVADLVRAFDEEMERVRANAYAEAENRVTEARSHAERIEREAEKVRAEAERAADEMMDGLESRRAALIEEVRRIHETLQRSAAAASAILQRGDRDVVVVDEPTRTQP